MKVLDELSQLPASDHPAVLLIVESVCRAPAKDTVDEYFLHASAAFQQEATAGPAAWDQIRS